MQTRHCICYESPRLLQRASGGPSTVNNRAAATSPAPLSAWLADSDLTITWLSSLRELHWLPIRYRIIFKLCLIMHNVHVGRSLRYIIDILSLIANMPNRGRFHSSVSSKYDLPALHLKIWERAFSYSGPAFWHSLPSELTSIMDT